MRNVSNPQKNGKKLANIFHNTQTAASVDVFACKKTKDNTTAKKTPLTSFSPTIRQRPRVLEKTSAFSTPEAIPRRREAQENYGELGVGVACFKQRLASDKLQYYIQNKNYINKDYSTITVYINTVFNYPPHLETAKKQQIHL